ncbi:hypothetical protein WJ06_28445 [Burkholderia cepacia]|nr:hypothetical protein WJ06_28445 [Burkholderia cepacia]
MNLEWMYINHPLQYAVTEIGECDASCYPWIDRIGLAAWLLGATLCREVAGKFTKMTFDDGLEPRHADRTVFQV